MKCCSSNDPSRPVTVVRCKGVFVRGAHVYEPCNIPHHRRPCLPCWGSPRVVRGTAARGGRGNEAGVVKPTGHELSLPKV